MPNRVALPADHKTALAGMLAQMWTDTHVTDRPSLGRGLGTSGPVMNFDPDQEIYGEGDAANVFFKVISGVIRICKFFGDGRRQIEAFHIDNEIFGFEPGAKYSFSAEAVSDCTVVAYRRRTQESMVENGGELSLQLFYYAMHGMARAQQHSLLLGRRSAIEKVAAFLLEWGEHSLDRKVVSLAMTRQDIADYLGLTIETVSRTLSQLERRDVIAFTTARQIRIKNPAGLRNLAT